MVTQNGDGDAERRVSAPDRTRFWVFLVLEFSLIPIALLLGLVFRQPATADLAWDPVAILVGISAAAFMVVLVFVTLRCPIGPIAHIKDFLIRELLPMLAGCTWAEIGLVCVVAGIGEEMLFRGVVQGALAKSLGPATGVVIGSILFGLCHPISRTYVVLAGLLGGFLGILWLLSGNLLAPIVAHGVYDFAVLSILFRAHSASESDR